MRAGHFQFRLKLLSILFLAFMVTTVSVTPEISWAQGRSRESEEGDALKGPRRQLATIIFAGLAGSILGLSTLSFYGRPQDHLENIALGFAVGVMTGTAYVTYKGVTQPSEFLSADLDDQWTRSGASLYASRGQTPKLLNYQWTF